MNLPLWVPPRDMWAMPRSPSQPSTWRLLSLSELACTRDSCMFARPNNSCLLVANFSVRATYFWQVYTNCSKTYSKLHNLGSTTGNQAILLATANDYCNRRRTTNHGGWSSCINNILIISDKSHVENRLGWLSYNSNWQLTIHNRIQITMVIIYHSYWGLHVLSKRATHATVNWWKW